MKWCLTKEQTEQAMNAGAEMKENLLSAAAYWEVLDSHPYKCEDGKYIIYQNLTIGDLFSRIPMVITPGDGFGVFEIDKENNKWKAAYYKAPGEDIFSTEQDEMIDALFDTYMFLLKHNKPKKETLYKTEDLCAEDDYFFTGRV